MNNPRGTRPPISDPKAIDSFIEDPYGGSGLGIVHRKLSPQDVFSAPPQRPPREDQRIPRLPFEPVQLPPSAHNNQHSDFRPVSSIYSQPSPNPITTKFARDQYETTSTLYTDDEGVSPPSSPEFDGGARQRRQYQSQDNEVSPIDEMPDVSRLELAPPSGRPGSSSKTSSSNIPTLRREKRRNQVAAQVSAAASNIVSRKGVGEGSKGRPTVDPRWDPYSGEITTSDRGKPQAVKPGTFAPPGLRPVHQPTGVVLGNTSSVTGGAKPQTSFSDRVRNLKSKNAVPVERPGWKGATGRVTLVSPVADRYDLPPLSLPRKNDNRIASPQSDTYSGSLTPVTIIPNRDDETNPASAHMSHPGKHSDPAIGSSFNDGRDSPSSVLISPTIVGKSFALPRTPPKDVSPTTSLKRSDTTTTIERNFREALKDVSIPGNESIDPYVQPPSRFSVTTYAPSEAQTTPRPSTDIWDTPPMPTPPQMYESSQQSVVNRKRPQIGEPMKPSISRKAINPGAPLFISMSSSVASKRSSNSTMKNLPITPAESQSHDLVTSLQAQLDDLAHRRINISRSIKQMTELMPKDSVILTDDVRRKREREKIKVEALRTEEADIRREEHDIGLRLHRAWKRRDKDAVYEPTGLWVRRVTG